MIVETFSDGIIICGTFPDDEIVDKIRATAKDLSLVVTDPPYGNIINEKWDHIDTDDTTFCSWMIDWTKRLSEITVDRSALYVFGGIGRPNFRPFYRYLVEVEKQTNYQLANHITWAKKRGYGIQWNYLFCREEIAYLTKGDIRDPHKFNIPLLDKKRGYAGYNEKYPAKSEYLRRTNVWMDITEILRNKIHKAQKPDQLSEIPIEIHTDKGDYVLDVFAGSGFVARAARKLGRRFILVEQDRATFNQLVANLQLSIP